MKPEVYRIREFESFTTSREAADADPKVHYMRPAVFETLENFLLSNEGGDDAGVFTETFLSLYMFHGDKRIRAKNYVGVIVLEDGTSVEILPKVEQEDDLAATVKIFRSMLCTVKDIPFERFRQAGLQDDRVPLFECFIRMFLDEAAKLVRQGLKCGYLSEVSNERFLKGKLLVSAQIRTNRFRKDRFVVEHNEFQRNIPENRLILTTLRYVLRHSHDAANRKNARKIIAYFEDVEESRNVEQDFARYTRNRNMLDYETILPWCRLFLQNRSFTALHGENVAFALLFPMEQLYESFVAEKLRRRMAGEDCTVTAQAGGYHLFDTAPARFPLRPDILVETREGRVVLDTKWKVLSNGKKNLGISQSDMYQMYAYGKRLTASRVILVYPYVKDVKLPDIPYCEDGSRSQPVTITCTFFDLLNVESSLDNLERLIRGSVAPAEPAG